jgi:RND family efflux transporter MFP subunit
LTKIKRPPQAACEIVHRLRERAAMRLRPSTWFLLALTACAAAAVGVVMLLPARVVVVHPTRGPAVQAVYATGTVESTVMLPIAARLTARLAQLDVDEGARVSKGQTLGRLEDTDLRNALAQLRSQEAYAHSDYLRDAALVKSGMVPKSTYDKARADWLAAGAASTKAQAEMDFAKLVAPADGLVIQRDGEVGQMIPVNQAVYWIAVDSPLRIAAQVDEEDINRVQPGQPVLIRADAVPDRVMHGTVQSITPKGDPVARSYRVRVGLAEATPLQIGMTVEVNIIVRKNEDALLLPPSAISASRVWCVRDARLVPRTVTTGASGDKQVEILSGIGPDDLVVLHPGAALRAGARVRTTIGP